ncbi:MAG TPA: hypothetical protein VHM19_23050 [Polyangiales bacterium]|jgi:hypothetical protein|nr:hypothetical protein [Polyangiales bacterium]
MASRQLICIECLPKMERISQLPDVVAAGETMRAVRGTSRGSYCCDNCSADLPEGKPCAAVTVLSRGEQLGAWEPDYVTPAKES